MIASDEVIRFEKGGYYDDGSGPAAMPPSYEGYQPSEPIAEPGGDRPIVIATRISSPAPVLIDAATPGAGGGGVTVNAPKVPETPAAGAVATLTPPGAATPVIKADAAAAAPASTATTTSVRVMTLSVVVLAIVVALIAWREGNDQ